MKKQISMEDMAELICSYYCDKGYCPCDCKNCDNHKFAEEIIKGYRKISENAVVLTREEYEVLKIKEKEKHWLQTCMSVWENAKIDARKETAREIYKFADDFMKWDEEMFVPSLLEFIKEKYGVEVK